jgi:LPXTG-site transpeptidase (sortase) family protein
MKNKLLIILGTLFLLVALINSFDDIRTLVDIDFHKLPFQTQNTNHEDNLESGSVNNDQALEEAPDSQEKQSTQENFPLSTDEANTDLSSPGQGFLPLQVEIEDTLVTPVSTPLAQDIPERIVISSIDLDAPIVKSKKDEVEIASKKYTQWYAPDEFAVGWQFESAALGQIGNTVLIGHHNVFGEVFKDLDKTSEGDRILIYGSSGEKYAYIITNVMILFERDATLAQRLDNAKWTLPSSDERITLITCWPHYSNTHRLIIVARPEIIDFKEIMR